MVDDAVGVLDELGIEQAHWVGASMGGMIAQIAAAEYPARVLSLASIMSNTNEPHLPTPNVNVLLHMTGIKGNKVVDVESAVKNRLNLWGLISGGVYSNTPEFVAERAEANFLRSYRPQGSSRHSMAIMATGGFAKRLKKITAPTVIIHGNKDPLLPVAGGLDSVKAIPGAKMKIIDGMGHELPEAVCPYIVELICENIATAETSL